jgi:hypothetical protein
MSKLIKYVVGEPSEKDLSNAVANLFWLAIGIPLAILILWVLRLTPGGFVTLSDPASRGSLTFTAVWAVFRNLVVLILCVGGSFALGAWIGHRVSRRAKYVAWRAFQIVALFGCVALALKMLLPVFANNMPRESYVVDLVLVAIVGLAIATVLEPVHTVISHAIGKIQRGQ